MEKASAGILRWLILRDDVPLPEMLHGTPALLFDGRPAGGIDAG